MTETVGLVGRTAIVSGGASGIGRAIVLELARQGATVAVFDVNDKKIEELKSELTDVSINSYVEFADVTKRPEVEQFVSSAYEQLGRIDILVNCAGVADYGPFWEICEERWDRVLTINLKGTYYTMQSVISGMMEQRFGRIINISSVGGTTGTPLHSHYSASKAGMIGLTKAVAKEVAPHGVTVNAVAPGLIETPMSHLPPEEWKQWVIERTPMKRMGTVDEIAGVVAFLAGDSASYITGQVISPNGGYVI